MGLSPEEIAWQPQPRSVHAALAYYHANPEEIKADLAEEEALADMNRIMPRGTRKGSPDATAAGY